MRIALVGPTAPYRGGISHHTTLLHEELRKDNDVLFVSFSRQYPKIIFPGATDREPGAEWSSDPGIEYLIDSMNPLTWISAARRIASFRPDVLLLPWWVVFWAPQFATLILLVRRLCGAKVTLLCHNVVEHEAGALKVAATRFVLSLADRIVTQSREETARVRELVGGRADVVTGFHPTYSPLCSSPSQAAPSDSLRDLSGNILLFFGFVRHYKGLDILLDAMPRVLEKRDATLLVVGEFWKDKAQYFEQMERLGLGDRVRVVDEYVSTEDMGMYFDRADLVVQPYRSATGSGVTQLAFGFEKPVIATRVGCLDEVIEDGVSGRVVPPCDPPALADALIESIDPALLGRLSEGARGAKLRFGWDRLAALLLEQTSEKSE